MTTEERAFEENFRETTDYLTVRSMGADFSIETVSNELEALYKFEGLDWVGRGELANAEIQGSIVAYQIFLRNWMGREKNRKTA